MDRMPSVTPTSDPDGYVQAAISSVVPSPSRDSTAVGIAGRHAAPDAVSALDLARAPVSTTSGLLIRTKLHPPITRQALVPRPRLQEKVAEGLRGPLTLVTAPAGFGKTTLMASCFAQPADPAILAALGGQRSRVAWLSLDRNDNEPARFLTYLVAALQQADSTVGAGAAQILGAIGRQASTEVILGSLINDLDAGAGAGGAMVLALDDYQFISSPAVHEAVTFLLEHCPLSFHMVIATRSDPPLPLARLRARDQVVELRGADLIFSEGEAAQFLNDLMNLHLDARSVAVLRERTEGWIAGLQMAALSLRDREDAQAFVQAFSGTNRYILDYLLEEVLSGQPQHVQAFLLQTSVLERLCAPLCDALLDREGEGEPVGSRSASVLEYLERANLFLMSLDDERRWYRYHRLFAGLLRARLEHSNPVEVPRLHLRASAWYAEHGLVEEAVSHALAAKDVEQAGRLINKLAEGMIAGSLSFKLSHWIGQLPDSYVRTQPMMCIALAWAYGYQGIMREQREYLDEAERHINPDDPLPAQREMRGSILALRSLAASTMGDYDTTISMNEETLDLISPGNALVRTTVGYNLGRAYLTLGDLTRAGPILWDTAQLCMRAGGHHILAPTVANIARLHRLQGRLHKAVEEVRPLQSYVEEHNPKAIHAAPYVYIGNLDALREWNRLEEAEALARRMLPELEPWKSQNCTCATATLLARVLRAQGRLDEAHDMLKFASDVIESNVPFGDIRSDLDAARVAYQLATGALPLAERWLEGWRKTHRAEPGASFTIIEEQDEITACRVLVARGQGEDRNEAARRLARLVQSTRAGGRHGRLIEIELLLAECLHAQGSVAEAVEALQRSLALAEPDGYVRVFLDEGEPVRTLLALWLARAETHSTAGLGPRREYAIRLLAQFGVQPCGAPILASQGQSPELAGVRRPLAEPLTPRELEVLNLMALGQTNGQIAGQLIVSVGTVKAHTASIYGKLDAANRTEAVARARHFGILP